MEPEIFTQFGLDWQKIVAQLICWLAFGAMVAVAIRSTIVSARTFRGGLAPLWILICWIVPFIGPLAP
jgi:hypothetical protein